MDSHDELVRYTAAEKTFAVRKGLPVYLLTASMCQGVEEQIPHLTAAYVHPGTFLLGSLEQHAWKFDRVTGEALVVVHIGTDDVSSGLSLAAIVGQMEALIFRMQRGHAEPLCVAVCSILPLPVDNQRTMDTVRDTNRRFQELSEEEGHNSPPYRETVSQSQTDYYKLFYRGLTPPKCGGEKSPL